MLSFDKGEIRGSLTMDNIFELLQEWGGDPEYTDFGIISATICHNHPGDGSRKLYYYENSDLFKCYTGCDASFDIFELTMKVFEIQNHQIMDLNDAVRYIAIKFGLSPQVLDDIETEIEDWDILTKVYDRVSSIELKDYHVQLKEYDDTILSRFNYNVNISPWLNENISQETIDDMGICFYPGNDQIVIPHYDKDGRLVGIRGRTLCQEEAERFGKYRPLRVNNQLYNHPLGMNLYNLNNSQSHIRQSKAAIVFEAEKSVLKYRSYFGPDNDITTACCGSNLSAYQVQALIDAGAEEIIVAFDRQFQTVDDDEFKHLTKNLTKIHDKYKNFVKVSFMFDSNMITGYKDSPIDCGKDIFLKLLNERISL